MDALTRYTPQTNIEEEIEPVISVIQRKQEYNSGLKDTSEMCLVELTLQKVRQLQTLDIFYNGMYHFIQ